MDERLATFIERSYWFETHRRVAIKLDALQLCHLPLHQIVGQYTGVRSLIASHTIFR
jgi:hypothetical protein